MIRFGPGVVRAFLAAAGALYLAALAVALTGGFSVRVGGLPIRAHGAARLLIAAAALTALALASGRAAVADALGWWWNTMERRAVVIAAVVSTLAMAAGVTWGTFAAGGSDSYCYLNQAELFARGAVHDAEPLGQHPSWPGTPVAFAPAGHNPSPADPSAIVPICPAGYPLILAFVRVLFGRTAMFWVTPVMGALAVYLTFLLARRAAGPAAGVLGATLAAASPIFLYQIIQPMNDVPAAALWCAALGIASASAPPPGVLRRDLLRGLLTGLVSGMAVAVRPNLVPLALVTAFGAALLPRGRTLRERTTIAMAAGAGTLPGVVLVMAIQTGMYGGPLRSGYGDLGPLFAWSHVVPNLRQYSRWVIQIHTPLILAALAAPFLARTAEARRHAIWLIAFAATTIACYLPYVVFDAWWYQRFLLPALLPLLGLAAAVVVLLLQKFPAPLRAVAFAAICTVFTVVYVRTAFTRGTFGMWEFEARFRTAGEYVSRLETNAAVITKQHSGSVRFYSRRSTVVWNDIHPGRLDDAIAFLRRHGRKPYLLVETGEEEATFRERFATNGTGHLDWPPIAEIDRMARIYDPADRERYRRGERISTARIISRRR